MPTTITLSESAVAVLRFRIKGLRIPVRERDIGAYRELVAAGIMEPLPDVVGNPEADFRFTEDGWVQREELLAEAQDRIERERFDPPDVSDLSEAAWDLLRRRSAGEKVPVDESTKPAYRELAVARSMEPVSGFIGGPESTFRFTYWGWNRRDEWIAHRA